MHAPPPNDRRPGRSWKCSRNAGCSGSCTSAVLGAPCRAESRAMYAPEHTSFDSSDECFKQVEFYDLAGDDFAGDWFHDYAAGMQDHEEMAHQQAYDVVLQVRLRGIMVMH